MQMYDIFDRKIEKPFWRKKGIYEETIRSRYTSEWVRRSDD